MGRQILVLLQMNLGGVKAWLGPALVVVLGTACVVGVLISTLSIGASFRLWGTKGTRPDRLIVTTPGDSGGAIKRDTVLALSNLEGVKRSADKQKESELNQDEDAAGKQSPLRLRFVARGEQPLHHQLVGAVSGRR